MPRQTIVEGIRITKVGLFYVLVTLIVGLAAANTGNNALYIVEALLLAVLVLSGFTSRRNVARLDIDLSLPAEAHANEPFTARLRLRNRDRWMARRLVVVEGLAAGDALLVPYLAPRSEASGTVQSMVGRRGRYQVDFVHLASVFPFGFFRKGLRIRQTAEMLIFPQLFAGGGDLRGCESKLGEHPSRRRGHGHELFNLRRFEAGDDRRGIHWKQTARTGALVYLEREAERGRRLSIVLDNGVGELANEVDRQRFESLISEAATAAHEALRQGYEVELLTRGCRVPLSGGPRQRRRLMVELALLEPVPRAAEPLVVADPRLPQLRLAMERRGAPVAGSGAS